MVELKCIWCQEQYINIIILISVKYCLTCLFSFWYSHLVCCPYIAVKMKGFTLVDIHQFVRCSLYRAFAIRKYIYIHWENQSLCPLLGGVHCIEFPLIVVWLYCKTRFFETIFFLKLFLVPCKFVNITNNIFQNITPYHFIYQLHSC